MTEYVCYLLVSESSNKTYIGITNHLSRRIRQHNGECSGGAKYTCQSRPWKVYGYVSGFGENKSLVLKFEWRWKYLSRKEKGEPLQKRINAVNKLILTPKEYINSIEENIILKFITF
jgi:predicted GIY-YIG superfamily endonuclease